MKEINALALALEVEKAELRFYIEMAKRAKDERAKKNVPLFGWRRG